MVQEGKCPAEAMGIVISYSVRVKLNCGTLGGELITDVPFKLMHPAPGKKNISVISIVFIILNVLMFQSNILFSITTGSIEKEKAMMKKSKSIDRARYENSCYANDDDDNIVFEDFARLRLNEPE